MTDMEKVINIYANCILNDKQCCSGCYTGGPGLGIACRQQVLTDAFYLLKEQEEQVKQWTKEIADNQLAHAPDELNRENWDYKKGIWDGLQIAWNIISEGR